jgi:cytochrome c-type biogenesis protein
VHFAKNRALCSHTQDGAYHVAELTYAAAAFAGALSFLSPCVLPLVPPYLSYLAGTTLDELVVQREAHKKFSLPPTWKPALFFVLGFSTVFIALGATASALGGLLSAHMGTLTLIAGAFIILMGLHFLGLFRIAAFYKEARFTIVKLEGSVGAYLMGLAFAFGWTPCIGPILASILALAGSENTVGQGAVLLAVYSAGLGIPFMLAAFAMRPFLGFMQKFRKHMMWVEKAMGAFLVLTGIAFLTGTITDMSIWLLETFPVLQKLG